MCKRSQQQAWHHIQALVKSLNHLRPQGQRCLSEHRALTTRTGRPLILATLGTPEQSAEAAMLLAERPEVVHLERCARLLLLRCGTASDSAAAEERPLQELPRILSSKVIPLFRRGCSSNRHFCRL